MECVKCHNYPIANKHFKLCIICNKKRLDEKKTSKPSSFNGAGSFRTKKRKTKPKSIKKVSQKGILKAEQKRAFRTEIFSQRENICTGCTNTSALTLSHTIPVSLREDLEFEGRNVHIECMACHVKWEHGSLNEKKKLLSYEQKVVYIKEVDPHYYERKFNKDEQ